ncbi:GDCCVxC domain-containing (seleno)protein [Thiomonas sp.]|uniref:GDCCVxC domain-containing (seleno)protein n=1 Tax=Thiomonas sp. TaxID=2047785 RepID=UPI0026399654|nr:GDCCVxC domain-containing (seleno)protein [Thiomonas sp.]
MSAVVLESVLSCPHCGFASRENMPVDACRFFHECPACATVFAPLPGDCCVFCSYGSVPCPPVQQRRVAAGPEAREPGAACC